MRSRRTRRILLAATTLLALAMLAAACGPAAPPIASTPQADDIVVRTNYVRGLNGIAAMTVDRNMQVNAQFEAKRVADAVRSCGDLTGGMHSPELGSWYSGFSAAENLACVPGCPPDGKQPFDMWVNSPSHSANQMNPAYTYIGTAAYCNGSVMVAVGHYRSG